MLLETKIKKIEIFPETRETRTRVCCIFSFIAIRVVIYDRTFPNDYWLALSVEGGYVRASFSSFVAVGQNPSGHQDFHPAPIIPAETAHKFRVPRPTDPGLTGKFHIRDICRYFA